MALAQICKCGHTKTDHMAINKKGELTRYHCEWYDCSCKKFIFATKKSMNQGFVHLPTLIDCNIQHTRKKKYDMTDCDTEGIIRDFVINVKKFDHGEYP